MISFTFILKIYHLLFFCLQKYLVRLIDPRNPTHELVAETGHDSQAIAVEVPLVGWSLFALEKHGNKGPGRADA
jgi:hypothetical protein